MIQDKNGHLFFSFILHSDLFMIFNVDFLNGGVWILDQKIACVDGLS